MVKFIYSHEQNIVRDKVVSNVIRICYSYLQLPNDVIVEYKKLDHNVYAETIVSSNVKNKIILNEMLTERDVIKPVIHELIHMEQMHTGTLSVYRSGDIYWQGRPYFTTDQKSIDYHDYTQLPWEEDVLLRESKLLKQVLESL
jgi:hypothetical protein